MSTVNTRDLFEEVLSLSKKIEDKHQDAVILFVDLAGSTEFKSNNGALLGLQKTFIHNSLVTQVTNGKGEVVKYIGDEVMIVVKGPDSPSVACRLAIDIQLELARLHERNSNNRLFPIEAKIGIHSGKVLYWEYPGHEQLDPQGTEVDIAARIVSLAKPKQILCSEETARRAQLDATKMGPHEERDVKGIQEPIRILEVMWDGQQRGIAQHPLPASEDKELRQLVREGQEAVDKGNIDVGIFAAQTALSKAPKDFEANFLLGLILAKKDQIPESQEYVERARRANPNSPSLWLLKGFLDWQEYEGSGSVDVEALDRIIEHTERCLTLANDAFDRAHARFAQGNLAYYLTQRGREGDWERAVQLCESVKAQYKKIETQYIAGFLDTCAFVLLQQDREDAIREARKLLEDAMQRDKKNPYILERMAGLIRKELALGIEPDEAQSWPRHPLHIWELKPTGFSGG